MSVEGLWICSYGDASAPKMVPGYSNAGVVVLESQRIFGGDAGYFYLGNYGTSGGRLRGRARITHFNGPLIDAFRTGLKSFEIEIDVAIGEGQLVGNMYPVGQPDRSLPILLIKQSDLP